MTDQINVLASTCPVCGAGSPEPCAADGRVHNARKVVAAKLANAVAAMHQEQSRVATAVSRRRRIDAMLEEDPHGLSEAITNWQVLNEPPSRLKTSPYPIVSSGRGLGFR